MLHSRHASSRKTSSCDSPNTSRRFVLDASSVCLGDENPTCSVPPLSGCEGIWSQDYVMHDNEASSVSPLPPPPLLLPETLTHPDRSCTTTQRPGLRQQLLLTPAGACGSPLSLSRGCSSVRFERGGEGIEQCAGKRVSRSEGHVRAVSKHVSRKKRRQATGSQKAITASTHCILHAAEQGANWCPPPRSPIARTGIPAMNMHAWRSFLSGAG